MKLSMHKFHTVFFIINFVLAVVTGMSLSDDTTPRYKIKAAVDVEKKLITATQTVIFTNPGQTDIQHLYFHLYPNRHYTEEEKSFMMRYAGYFKINPFPEGFQSSDVRIQLVKGGGENLSFLIEGEDKTILKVTLARPLRPQDTVEVVMDFSLTIPHAYGRFGWHENITTLSRWYPLLSVYKQDGWANYPFYPFHRPFFSEASLYSVELTVPADQIVIHSGQLEKEERLETNKTLYIDSQLPIREFSLAMSPDYKVYEEKMENVTIKSFYLSGEEDRGKKAWQSAADVMKFYSELFGAYPYETFSIAPVYLGYGGEQMSNMVFIDTRVYKLPGFLDRYFDFLVSHETGHQWFYNLVGVNEYEEIWLEEGVHSYFLLEHLERKYGKDAAVVQFPLWAKGLKRFVPNVSFRRARDVRYKVISRIGLDSPVIGKLSSFQEPSSIFSITYGKGSRILGMLREVMGKENFERTFARIFKEFRFKNLSVEEFKKICEEESRQNLTAFFDRWLYTTKKFDVSIVKVEGNQIFLSNKEGIGMAVPVRVKLADGRTKNFIWNSEKLTDQIAIEESSKIVRVELDPEDVILDIDRTNNFWPRQLNIQAVPLYLGLYDIPVLMPEDSYNLVFGPELANGGLGAKVSVQKPFDQNFYAGTDYEFFEGILHSRVGYELDNLFHSQTAVGFEIANRSDYDDGDEDLVSGKVFLRKELWPVQYGLSSINDHVTLYVIRNQGLNNTLLFGGTENSRNISYLKRSEAIVGINLHFERSAPYPDPNQGYRVDTFFENSGHFLEAAQHFNRGAIDTSFYYPVTQRSKLALRMKYGGGFPDDRNLFELGGPEGLRGFDRKSVRGSNALLGSLEYRFPLKDKLHLDFFDHVLGLESVGGVVFFDAGESWYSSFEESDFKKDAGLGLRFTFNVGSFLEKIVVRADIAQAINDPEDDTHFWFGVNHAF